MENKTTVMIVDDVEQTRTDIKRLLYFEEDIEVVAEAADGLEAVRKAKELRPQVILMDINMPGMDGIEATEEISMNDPQAAIIIVSIQGETEYLRKAMLAGARDYLVKPLGSDQLSHTIRKVASLLSKRHPGTAQDTVISEQEKKHIRCIYSPVGGAGKSVLASNLAVLLAQKKKAVALLDLDLQFGSIADNLNLKPDRTWEDLAAEELSAEDVSSFLIPHFSGVKVLASPAKPQADEMLTSEILGQTMDVLEECFSELIVDLPTALTEKVLEIMERASEIYLVATPDMAAVRKVKTFLESLRALELETRVSLLLNRADQPEALKAAAVEDVLEIPISYKIPCDNNLVLNSINRGIPFVLNQGSADISLALGKLLEGSENTENNTKKRGILSFFSF